MRRSIVEPMQRIAVVVACDGTGYRFERYLGDSLIYGIGHVQQEIVASDRIVNLASVRMSNGRQDGMEMHDS